jgi:hypothetical protein
MDVQLGLLLQEKHAAHAEAVWEKILMRVFEPKKRKQEKGWKIYR